MVEMSFVFTLWSVTGSCRGRDGGVRGAGEGGLGSRQDTAKVPEQRDKCAGRCRHPAVGTARSLCISKSQLFCSQGISVQKLSSGERSKAFEKRALALA